MSREEIDKLANRIIGLAIDVHRELGPGFVEKIYQKALAFELDKAKIGYKSEKNINVKYKDLLIGYQRIDFLIEELMIIELKSVSEINEIHLAQMISYLRTIDKRLGLILNFARPKLEIKRVVNKF